MRYTEEFKARMIERMVGPEALTATMLSDEVNVPQPTLSRWQREAANVVAVKKKKRPKGEVTDRDDRTVDQWTADEKLRVIAAASQLQDQELGAFLRREGLHLAQLEQWRQEIITALDGPQPGRRDPNAKKVRTLERELARKDKALAEVTALLVLRKKLEALFETSEEEGDSTTEPDEKK
jgi:transposase